MDEYGIVIIGYKNTEGIKRLLKSIQNVDFLGNKNIKLIFSIDYSGDNAVKEIAQSFNWEYGEKIILAYNEKLGLKKHVLLCGNYMNCYNLSAIAVFEDDIYVSPNMFSYFQSSVQYYKSNKKIAGISLYKHEFNINAKHPFLDYADCGDVFFMQYAMSWGQIWIKEKWNQFIDWYNAGKWQTMDSKKIPNNLMKWKESWLKYHIMYCIDQDLYFVYPRISLATNFSDVGTHNKFCSTSMQVKLCMKKEAKWDFISLDDTLAVYDAFFENIKLSSFLGLENLVIDLYGAKNNIKSRFILTQKNLPYKIIRSWGLKLRPIEANIIYNIPGEVFFLYDTSVSAKKNRNKAKHAFFEYDLKGVNIICFSNLKYCFSFIMQFLKNKFKKILVRRIK